MQLISILISFRNLLELDEPCPAPPMQKIVELINKKAEIREMYEQAKKSFAEEITKNE